MKSEVSVPRQLCQSRVTARAFWLGLLLSVGLAAFNCWIEMVANVHFVGGVQMPFGSIFVLMVCALGISWPLRALGRRFPILARLIPTFSPTELLTIYCMALFAALISTPGADNFFLTVTPNLFYFASRENNWATLFYDHVPRWFAPGWDGHTYQREVIEPLFTGGLKLSQIPWHAWTMMLLGWSVLLLCAYSTLFFASLLLRRQWIENEALAFPLIQLPLQMVQVDDGQAFPPAREFWSNKTLWAGVLVAFGFHIMRGMNQYFPDWPQLSGFQNGAIRMEFTERPWNAMGGIGAEVLLGAVGVAYLLTREVSFSFWFFYLLSGYQMVLADQLGFGVASLPHDSYTNRPTFIAFQSVGGWIVLTLSLLWTARGHLQKMAYAAWRGDQSGLDEPFAPRFTVCGFFISLLGTLSWSWFAGINPLFAALFFTLYLGVSLVIARIVVEGGLLFPQLSFSPLEVLTTAVTGTQMMGVDTLTKLSCVLPSLLSDTRTNTLPGFLHTLKVAHELKLDPANTRRLMGSVAVAVIATLGVTIFVSVATLYKVGGLSCYSWFTTGGGRLAFGSASNILAKNSGVAPSNLLWIAIGILITTGLIFTRARLAWFPLHPLGYIVASSYPLQRLWFSFFLGWLIKTVLNRFGGYESVQKVQPFMIGLILGNVCAMVTWLLIGLREGVQIPYWPA